MRASSVHALPSLQSVGQRVVGSQVSPGSITPSPQVPEQSVSLFELQMEAQQSSPLVQTAISS
jgi:hypothetical protein